MNKVADLLVNTVDEENGALRLGRLEYFEEEQWMPRCRQLVAMDAGRGG